jgi:hypothetical protein
VGDVVLTKRLLDVGEVLLWRAGGRDREELKACRDRVVQRRDVVEGSPAFVGGHEDQAGRLELIAADEATA